MLNRFCIFFALALLGASSVYADNCIGDRVWYDVDRDGVQGETERGIAGVAVSLVSDAGEVIDSMVTNYRGYFGLCGPVGQYTMQVDAPEGLEPTVAMQGTSWRAFYDDSNIDALGVASVRIRDIRSAFHYDAGLRLIDEPVDEPVDEPAGERIVLHVIGDTNAAGVLRRDTPPDYLNRIGMIENGEPIRDGGARTLYGLPAVLADRWVGSASVTLLQTTLGGSAIGRWIDVAWPEHLDKIRALNAPDDARHVVVWIQGNADATDNYTRRYSYADKTRELFGLIRAELPDAQVIDVLLSAGAIWGGDIADQRVERAIARNGKKQAVAQSLPYVTAIGGQYAYTGDQRSFSAAGYESMADDVLAVVNGEVPASEPSEPLTLIYGRAAAFVRTGDVDGDGLVDIVVGGGSAGHTDGSILAWFKAPDWQRFDIETAELRGYIGDGALADIDGDGDLDLAIPYGPWRRSDGTSGGGVAWYEQTDNGWMRRDIVTDISVGFHFGEIRAADIDADGDVDVVIRHLGGDAFRVYRQESSEWSEEYIRATRRREGLDLADIDDDGLLDIIGNGFILFAPDWKELVFAPEFINQDMRTHLADSTKSASADMNGDGNLDIVIGQAEGEDRALAVFLAPDNARAGAWQRITIEPSIRTHQLHILDYDNDGDLDVMGGTSWTDDGVYVWLQDAGRYTRTTITDGLGIYNGDVLPGNRIAGPTTFAGTVWLHQ